MLFSNYFITVLYSLPLCVRINFGKNTLNMPVHRIQSDDYTEKIEIIKILTAWFSENDTYVFHDLDTQSSFSEQLVLYVINIHKV